MSNTQPTLLAMYHPDFRKGYQAGRKHTFEQQTTLTDMQLVTDLQSLFQENDVPKGDESIYYTIGHLIGQISAAVLPRQPSEDNTQALQEAFLLKIKQTYEATGQALIETIRQFWTLQDQLAQTLEADLFVQMIKRGIEPKSL